MSEQDWSWLDEVFARSELSVWWSGYEAFRESIRAAIQRHTYSEAEVRIMLVAAARAIGMACHLRWRELADAIIAEHKAKREALEP